MRHARPDGTYCTPSDSSPPLMFRGATWNFGRASGPPLRMLKIEYSMAARRAGALGGAKIVIGRSASCLCASRWTLCGYI